MKNNELAQKQDLCAFLNMNFDEANELFSSETLSNMKMAQINGGGPLTIISIIVTCVSIGVTIYQIKYADGSGVTEQSGGPIRLPDGRLMLNGMEIDSMKITPGQTIIWYPTDTQNTHPTGTGIGGSSGL